MQIFHRILKTAIDGGASDVHIKIGYPVIFRINRHLVAIECPSPTAEWMENVVAHIVPPHARARLDSEREVDFCTMRQESGGFEPTSFSRKASFVWRCDM